MTIYPYKKKEEKRIYGRVAREVAKKMAQSKTTSVAKAVLLDD